LSTLAARQSSGRPIADRADRFRLYLPSAAPRWRGESSGVFRRSFRVGGPAARPAAAGPPASNVFAERLRCDHVRLCGLCGLCG